MPIHR